MWFYETAGARETNRHTVQMKMTLHNNKRNSLNGHRTAYIYVFHFCFIVVQCNDKETDEAMASVWSWPQKRQTCLSIVIIIFLLISFGVRWCPFRCTRPHQFFFSSSPVACVCAMMMIIITMSFRFLLGFFLLNRKKVTFSFVFDLLSHFGADARTLTLTRRKRNLNCCRKKLRLHAVAIDQTKCKQNKSHINCCCCCGGGGGCCWCPKPNPIFGAYIWKKGHANKNKVNAATTATMTTTKMMTDKRMLMEMEKKKKKSKWKSMKMLR